MIVRAITDTGDWTFGKGRNDYKVNSAAVAQNIKTRLQSFKNDCFFAAQDGADWWNILGGKSLLAIQLAVTSIILNTDGVTSIVSLSISLDKSRNAVVKYEVTSVYSLTKNLSGLVQVGGL